VCIGDADVAFLGEVCLRDKHDIYVMDVEEHFEFICCMRPLAFQTASFRNLAIMYVSVVRRFSIDPSWSKRPFIIVLSW
jgi:hypothetical protein